MAAAAKSWLLFGPAADPIDVVVGDLVHGLPQLALEQAARVGEALPGLAKGVGSAGGYGVPTYVAHTYSAIRELTMKHKKYAILQIFLTK